MAYTIYRRVKVLEIRTELVTPNRRPSDISGDTFREEPYNVTKASFSNHHSGTIHHIEDHIIPGQIVSIAINDFKQVIAVVNHSTGKHSTIDHSFGRNVKEHIIAMLYISPFIAFGIWLLWRSLPYFDAGDDTGFLPASFGAGSLWLGIFIFRKYIAESVESKKALKALRLEK